MKKKILGIAIMMFVATLIGGGIGYREANIIQNKTAPFLALKYMANLNKLQSSECKQDYWSMYSEIETSIVRYSESYEEFSLLGLLPSYAFLNKTYPIKKLLDFQIKHLQGLEQKTESQQAKLVLFLNLAKKIE